MTAVVSQRAAVVGYPGLSVTQERSLMCAWPGIDTNGHRTHQITEPQFWSLGNWGLGIGELGGGNGEMGNHHQIRRKYDALPRGRKMGGNGRTLGRGPFITVPFPPFCGGRRPSPHSPSENSSHRTFQRSWPRRMQRGRPLDPPNARTAAQEAPGRCTQQSSQSSGGTSIGRRHGNRDIRCTSPAGGAYGTNTASGRRSRAGGWRLTACPKGLSLRGCPQWK